MREVLFMLHNMDELDMENFLGRLDNDSVDLLFHVLQGTEAEDRWLQKYSDMMKYKKDPLG